MNTSKTFAVSFTESGNEGLNVKSREVSSDVSTGNEKYLGLHHQC